MEQDTAGTFMDEVVGMTNADRIRAMCDEQLAEMFVRHDAKCYLEGHLDKTGYLIYLQQEVYG